MNQSLIEGRRGALATLLLLAWPAIVEQILLTAVTYVDSAMVGSLGAGATAAVAVCQPLNMLFNGLFNALGVGYSVQLAHAIGAKEPSRARQVMRQGVLAVLAAGSVVLLVIGLLARRLPLWLGAGADILPDARAYAQIWALSLLFLAASNCFSTLHRGMGDTRTPLMVNALTNLCNVALNFLFIFPSRTISVFGRPLTVWGAGLGVAGAALGTALSLTIGASLLAWSLYHRPEPYKICLRDSYRPDRAIIKQAVRLGVPMACDRVIISAGQLLSTRLIAGLGTVSLAAHHIAVTAEGLCYLPANGIGFAATTLVGQSMGARRPDLAEKFGRVAGWVGMLLSGFCGGLLFVFARPVASIFTPDPEALALAARMLRIVAVALPMFGLAIVLTGALRGAGDSRRPFYYNMFGMWLLRIPLAVVLLRLTDLGLAAVWIAMALDLTVRGVLCALRHRSGKWRALPPVPALPAAKQTAR